MTQRILSYRRGDDGRYILLVDNLNFSSDEMQLLDNGYELSADISVHDPYNITSKQRKKSFAIVNDIESHTGQPREYLRAMFADYLRVMNGYTEKISLSDCSKQIAGELIEIIIEWVFLHHIPLNYRTSDLMREDNRFIYLATVNRQCVICGKTADLAHREAVGSGRDRNKINHIGMRVLALCRKHHTEQHQIGVDSFDVKYHLKNSWIVVDEKLNGMLRGG